MTSRLKDKWVLITGASSGFGAAAARAFGAEGAKLLLGARRMDRLERVAEESRKAGAGEVHYRALDVSKTASVEQFMVWTRQQIRSSHNQTQNLHVLINNAGIIQVCPLEHMTPGDFEEAMGVHFWGPLHTTLAAVPVMREQGGGRIVNVSSIGGKIGVPHLAPYCASKFALTGLSDAFRAELDRDGIRITTVCPGLMRTGSPRNAQVKGQHEAEYAWFAIADALPGLSISAERAAEQIVEACRYGDPELTYTLPARLAI